MNASRPAVPGWLAAAMLAVASSMAVAGPSPHELSDDGARVTRLAENVFAIEHDDATDEWPHGNTGVIVGRSAVFVIDSCYLPSRARADIELIRRITDKPVRFLMTTHWHFDHNNGAIAYREAFPDVTLIAERNTARWIELKQHYWRRLSTAPDSARRASPATLEAELARGAAADGAVFDDAERGRREAVISRRRNELHELGQIEVPTPARQFDGRLSLDFEGVRIEVEDRGPGQFTERGDRLAAARAHPVRRRHPRALALALRRRVVAGALGAGAARDRVASGRGDRAGPCPGDEGS